MRKYSLSVFVFMAALFGGVFLWSSAYAAAPQITNVKFKAAGDSGAVAVFFDQPVFSNATSSQSLVASDFVLGGTSGTAATITLVSHSINPPSSIVVLSINTAVNATSTGQWTVAASSTQIFNMAGEAATTTATDFNGKGDSAAPAVNGVFMYANNALVIMFSEEGSSGMAFTGFQTAAVGDAPGILDAQLVPEKTFMILMTTASTTLSWGTGNNITVESFSDLVGNGTASAGSLTILPALKVSEVKAEAASANTQDEFIELYNFGDFDLNISTSTLFMHLRNGAVAKTLGFDLEDDSRVFFIRKTPNEENVATIAGDVAYNSKFTRGPNKSGTLTIAEIFALEPAITGRPAPPIPLPCGTK